MKKVLLALSVVLATATQAFSYTSLIGYDLGGGSLVQNVNGDTYGDLDSTTYKGYYATVASDSKYYYTGYYLGSVESNNDWPRDLKTLMNAYIGGGSIDYTIIKSDEVGSGLTVGFADSTKYYGTWSTTGSTPPAGVQFYSIKGSTSYALYFVDPSMQKGSWTSAHLISAGEGTATFSHMSATTSPVPVPSSALLLGTSILGLVGLTSRKRNRS